MSGIHKNIPVGAESAHPPGYVQSTDPGAVGAYKPWVDTSGGDGNWVYKIRNAANTAWETVAGGGGGGGGTFSLWDVNAPMDDPAVNDTLSRSFTASSAYADLTWVNQGTRSVAIVDGELRMTNPSADAAPGGLFVAPPTAPWFAMTRVVLRARAAVNMAGLALYNSSGTKVTRFKVYHIGGTYVIGVANGTVTGGYADVSVNHASPAGAVAFLGISCDASGNLGFYTSADGRKWNDPYLTTTLAAHLGAITGVGVFTAAVGGGNMSADFNRLVFLDQTTPIAMGAMRTVTGS